MLLLDDMAVHPTALPRIRETARRFVNRMSPGDRMAVVSFNGGAMTATDDRAQLLKTIDDYYTGGFPMRLEDAGVHVLNTVTTMSRQLAEAAGRPEGDRRDWCRLAVRHADSTADGQPGPAAGVGGSDAGDCRRARLALRHRSGRRRHEARQRRHQRFRS